MTQQLIDLGAGPDSTDGDSIYVAFTKTNENFTDLYTIIGSNGTTNLSGNTITANYFYTTGTVRAGNINAFADINTVGNVIAGQFLYPNGQPVGGNITAILGNINQDLIPYISNTYNIGSSTNAFGSGYFDSNIVLQGSVLTSDGTNLLLDGVPIAGVSNVTYDANSGNLTVSTPSEDFTVDIGVGRSDDPVFNTVTAQTFYGNIVGNISGNLAVPGNPTEIVFNANGAAGTSTNFRFDSSGNLLTVDGTANIGTLYVGANVTVAGVEVIDSAGEIVTSQLKDSGVTSGTYGNASAVPVITIDDKGRITFANTAAVAGVSNVVYDEDTGNLTISTSSGEDFTVDIGTGRSDDPIFANLTVTGTTTTQTFVVNTDAQVGGNITTDGLYITGNTLVIPTGNIEQRPTSAQEGMLRFNSNSDSIEWYTGSVWQAPITDYTIVTANLQQGDNTTVDFPLPVANATTAGTMVSINGIIQQPGIAYTIANANITFSEAPKTTDNVDIRIFTTTSTVTGLSDTYAQTQILMDQDYAGDNKIYIKNAGNTTAILEANSQIKVFANLESTSYTTGSMVVDGGIGVSGNVYINDTLYAVAKSFLIDHPTKPGYQLQYASLEGPENGVYVRGRSKTNRIVLPEHWTKLVDEETITVNLTPYGKYQQLYVTLIDNNCITVASDTDAMFDYYYTVWAERKDINKLIIEHPKA